MNSQEFYELESSSQSNGAGFEIDPRAYICLNQCPFEDDCHQHSVKCPQNNLKSHKNKDSGRYIGGKFANNNPPNGYISMKDAIMLTGQKWDYLRRRVSKGEIAAMKNQNNALWLSKEDVERYVKAES